MPRCDLTTYPLPAFPTGIVAPTVYARWLTIKGATLLDRDKKRGKPYALTATKSVYKAKIHQAVLAGGQRDPYTGEALDWKLISTWDTSHKQVDGYKKLFALMPTVDHTDPMVLEFEICSWRVNDCKSDMDPAQFVKLCATVAAYRGAAHRRGAVPGDTSANHSPRTRPPRDS